MAIDLDYPLIAGTYQNVNDVSGDITGVSRDITATRQTISSGTISSPPLAIGTTLPSSPFEGQEFYLQVQGPNVAIGTPAPQLWHLRWSGSGWDALSGSPLFDDAGTGGNSWVQLTINGAWYTATGRPIITVPYPGIYDVAYSSIVSRSTAATININVGIGLDGNDPPWWTDYGAGMWFAANTLQTIGGESRVEVNSTIDMRVLQNSTLTINYNQGQLFVTPVRLEPGTVFQAQVFDKPSTTDIPGGEA